MFSDCTEARQIDSDLVIFNPEKMPCLEVTVSNGVITLVKPVHHRTLEERTTAEFDAKLMLDGYGRKLSLTSKSTSPSSSSNDLIDRQILLFRRQSLKIHHSLML